MSTTPALEEKLTATVADDEKGVVNVGEHQIDYGDSTAGTDRREAEQRLVRKLDMRILPFLSPMYPFAYLDRSDLSNARLQGLPQDAPQGDPPLEALSASHLAWMRGCRLVSLLRTHTPVSDCITVRLLTRPLGSAIRLKGAGRLCYKTGVFVPPPSNNDFNTVKAGGATDDFLKGSLKHLVRRPDRYDHFMKYACLSAVNGTKQLNPTPPPRALTPPPLER
ncbi:hypothetical protein C8Q76DRAFT_802555 [Earliella scabrosa]|nr:hypothetical protein C8Q76DRAFT_802555 [Earliella scabrosa]